MCTAAGCLLGGLDVDSVAGTDAKGRAYRRVNSQDPVHGFHQCILVPVDGSTVLEPECPGEEATRYFYSQNPTEVTFSVDFEANGEALRIDEALKTPRPLFLHLFWAESTA